MFYSKLGITATLLGWRILRFTAKDIRSGAALATIEKALEAKA